MPAPANPAPATPAPTSANLAPAAAPAPSPLLTLLQQYEGSPIPSASPSAGRALQRHRRRRPPRLRQRARLDEQRQQKALSTAQATARNTDANATMTADALAKATALYNTAVVGTSAMSSFSTTSATSPIGMLNLERIEMTPAGIERGGLIATIPLAPTRAHDRRRCSRKWSVVKQGLQHHQCTDSLDNYSETGVTDNTQLAQSSTSQISHANQFNINTSASGSIGFVTTSVATDFKTQDQSSQSAANGLATALGADDAEGVLALDPVAQGHDFHLRPPPAALAVKEHPHAGEPQCQTSPMRVDYFSIMRKWHCALYRYGLRLTYDITIPEPGAAMREAYAQLDALQSSLSPEFVFTFGVRTHSEHHARPELALTLAF